MRTSQITYKNVCVFKPVHGVKDLKKAQGTKFHMGTNVS